ncbi:MAG: VTT domain-containing protein [Eubacteriales bacterium]|nr:VTT domain-containing protein [Eubacteriales bacterium]
MKPLTLSQGLRLCSLASFAVCIAAAAWCMKQGLFSSQQTMEHMLSGLGAFGPLLFILLQIVQVVVPIFPGGISCLAGVVLFGAWKGFACNYIGICIGSLAAFALSKSWGRPLLVQLFGQKLMDQYDGWTQNRDRFDRLFALAIFLPVAPDDFLCYLAGTTAMSWRKFILIIIFGKPLAIAGYSLLLHTIWCRLFWG